MTVTSVNPELNEGVPLSPLIGLFGDGGDVSPVVNSITIGWAFEPM